MKHISVARLLLLLLLGKDVLPGGDDPTADPSRRFNYVEHNVSVVKQ
jgi:hypothetical protein